jgi:2-keto-4-pentenoate hydratase/2-oxohepta-3-ene-1,7-dioic acid hydratase in catechol pathway
MRIVALAQGAQTQLGVVASDGVVLVNSRLVPDSDLGAVLADPDGLARIAEATAGRAPELPLADARLRPFLPRPNAIWALALNFRSHVDETGLQTSREYPHLFLRTAASFVGAGEPLRCPRPHIARAFDYEGELAVVIGRPGRYIPSERALEHVAGYTCMNEGSVREYQVHNRQFGLGKNFEGSGSYGPWLLTADAFGDPTQHTLLTRVNGQVRQRAPLSEMKFSVAEVISYLSQGYVLRPGDIIAMGTPGALPPALDDDEGRDMSHQCGPFKVPGLVHMQPGDFVEVEIDQLGALGNPVVQDG